MLDDDERKAIDELERQFAATATPSRPVSGTVQLVGALFLCALLTLSGLTAGALAFGAAAAAIWLARWYAHEPPGTAVHPRDGRQI